MKDSILFLLVLGGAMFVAYAAWGYYNDGVGSKLFRAFLAFIFSFGLLAGTLGSFMDKPSGGIEYEGAGPADACDVNRYC